MKITAVGERVDTLEETDATINSNQLRAGITRNGLAAVRESFGNY